MRMKGAEVVSRALFDCEFDENSLPGVSCRQTDPLDSRVRDAEDGTAAATTPNRCSSYASFAFSSTAPSYSGSRISNYHIGGSRRAFAGNCVQGHI